VRAGATAVRATLALVAVLLAALVAPAAALALSWNPVPGPSPMGTVTSAYELHSTSRFGTPWLTFRDNYAVHVRTWNGTAWSAVGPAAGFSPSGSNDMVATPQIAIDSTGTPFVTLTQKWSSLTPQVWVMEWNGSAWTSLSGVNINIQNGQQAFTPSIAVDSSDNVVVAWSEKENGGTKERRVWVKRWNGATWTQLGLQLNQATNDAISPSVAVNGTTPYVAFVEDNGVPGPDQVTVKQWTGAAWALVGPASLNLDPTKNATDPFMYVEGGTPYVAWSEPDATGKQRIVVKRWTGAAWVQDGASMSLQTAENASRPRLSLIGGTRYLSWTESYGSRGGRAAIASWTGAAWTTLPPFGVDPKWAQKTQYAGVIDSSGSPWMAYMEGSPSTVYVAAPDASDQTASGVLVPNSDMSSSGFSKRTTSWTTCTTSTTALYSQTNEDIDQPLSSSCIAYRSSGEYIFSGLDTPLSTVDWALTNSYPLVMAYSLKVRVRAYRSGTKNSTLIARIRKADNTILGTPPTWTLSGSWVTYEYDITALNLSQADVDGLHLDVEVAMSGAGTSGQVNIATANVGLNFVGTDCGTPPCPPIRPDNLSPIGGTANPTPQLTATEFVDTDFHAHTASQWQVRTNAGTYATPFEDSGITGAALTAYTMTNALTLDQVYWFRVRYRDSSNAWSAWSNETSFAYDTGPPDPPQGRRIDSRTTTSIDVIWDFGVDDHSLPEDLRYDVEYSPTGASWSAQCTGVLGPQVCTATVGTAATPGYFRIRSIDEAGNVGAWGYYADATAATYYLRETVGSSLLTNAANGTIDSTNVAWASTVTPNLNTLTGFWQFQRNATATAAAAMPASINPATTGRGWMFDSLAGASVNDGPITYNFELTASKVNGTAFARSRMFTTNTSGGNVSAPTSLPDDIVGEDNILGTISGTTIEHVRTLASPTTFAANTALYFETWLEVTVASASSGGAQVVSMTGSPTIEIAQPGAAPTLPSALSPAAAASVNPLTMQATYAAGSGVAGHLVFEVWSDSAGSPGVLLETGYSAFELAAAGTAGSYSTVTLDPGSYHWRVRSEDRQGRVSAWTAYRAVTITPPNVAPNAPTHVSLANGSTTADTTPTLTATFTDPNAPNTGTLTFEVCSVAMAAGQSCVAAGGAVQSTGSTAAGIVNGANASWTSGVLTAGTRYWHVRATDNLAATGAWSASWSLVIGAPSMTVTVDNANQALGVQVLGLDDTAITTVSVTTSNSNGYNLTASDTSDTTGMQILPAGDTLPDWTGTMATPTTWAASTSGYFGLTVLCVNSGPPCVGVGAKDTAKWGTGTADNDFVNNKYAALKTTPGTIHNRATYSAATDTVTVGYRANFSSAESAGTYTTTVTYTGTANP
jgi:hypothetical protein